MKANLFLLCSIITILIAITLSPGSVNAQAPQVPFANPIAPDNLSIPAGLSAADWAEITALLPEQQAYLKASNTQLEDGFGYSVALSGDTVVVGAPEEFSAATGVDGDQDDNSASYSGAAYVFVRTGSAWSQQAYLKASNSEEHDRFGVSVALSGDTVVVGAPEESSAATGVDGDQNDNSAPASGAAYVFVRVGSAWSQQAYLKASNSEEYDSFGASVALSGDTIVVGAPEESSAATDINGDQNDNSEYGSGAAYVFTRAGGTWSQQVYLKASNTEEYDRFGRSVALSGDTVVVGAPEESSAATGVNGDQSDNSAFYSGAAYVFVRAGGIWSQQAYLKASNTEEYDSFGVSVALSGDTIAVGAPEESSIATGVDGVQNDDSASYSGAAYVFVRTGGIWSQQAYLKASNTEEYDSFGVSVALSGDTVVVGAPEESSAATGVDGDQNDNSEYSSGAAYIFVRAGGTWMQQAYLKTSNTEEYDRFGSSVALSGDTVVVGTMGESSVATGVDGDQDDNSAPASGAAYVFFSPSPTFPTTPILDNFNRTNGGLGPNWMGTKTSFQIVNNEVDVRGDGPIYWKDAFGADQEAYVTISAVDSWGKEQDLLLKVQGRYAPNWGNGGIEAWYNAPRGIVTISTFRPNTLKWFKYPSIPVTFANGDQFGAQALATGEVVIFKNGTEVGRVTLNPADQSFFNARGGRIGLWFISARKTIFDDFGGGTITPP
jgi:drug/metabolite transporter superfamily protein YnfA